MRRLAFGVFALVLSLQPLVACAESAAAQLKHFLADVRAFNASFEQQQFDEQGTLVETARGKVCIARPGRFNWDYQTPYQQRIVSDGKTLWVYDADLAQVTVNPVNTNAADSPARLLGDDFDLEASFTVGEAVSEAGIDWVSLGSKQPKPQFKAVRIGFREGELAVMRLQDNLGQTTEIRFTQIARNPAVPPATFTFTPPTGVDIIHGTGG